MVPRHREYGAASKADQGKLNSVLCVLIALHWRLRPREASLLLALYGSTSEPRGARIPDPSGSKKRGAN